MKKIIRIISLCALCAIICSSLLAQDPKEKQPQKQSENKTSNKSQDSTTNLTLPGLYVDGAFHSKMDLYDTVYWIAQNAQSDGNYTIVIGEDAASPSITLDCGGKKVSISLKSSGGERKVTFATRSPSIYLFTVKTGVTFILEEGVMLVGLQSASRPLVGVDGGEFIMNGGVIKDSIVDSGKLGELYFGGGVYISSGIFTMNGGTISGNSSTGGGGVYVGNEGAFTMNNGTISGNTGGGVWVHSGRFTMNDGAINGNKSTNYRYLDQPSKLMGGYTGGGVYVIGGTFKMSGGIINNNYSEFGGGGVCVESGSGTSGGMFEMINGTISGNSSPRNNSGGVYVGKGGTFTMNNGTIGENTGGVGVFGGTFKMTDGTIIGNTKLGVSVGGTASFVGNTGSIPSRSILDATKHGGIFTMVNGTISGNRSGGVYVSDYSKFVMTNGVISGNTASNGGGVHIVVGGTFEMTNGTISGNTATDSGGGVFAGGTFIKSGDGGIIYGSDATKEQANKANKYGHAVYSKNGSRDTTARVNMALDSTKVGAAGGWE